MSDSPVVAARPRKELIGWRNALFATFFLSGLSVASWVARTPAVKEGLDIGLDQVGLLIFGMSAGSVVGLIVAPRLLGRFGARRAILIDLLILAIGVFIIGVGVTTFSSFAIAYVGMILFGFGNGCVDVCMNVEAAAAERELNKTVMPLMHAFFSFGTVAGAAIGTLAAGIGISVVVHLTGIAVAIMIAAVVVVRFIPLHIPGETALAGEKLGFRARLTQSLSVWKDKRLILIGVLMLGMAFAEGSANDWLTLAVAEGHGQPDEIAAAVFTAFVIAMTVGRVVGGPILDRLGRVPVLQGSAVMAVVGLLMFILADQLWLIVIGTILWGLGCALGFPVGMSAAADDEANAAARVSAVAIIGYCAFLVGPPVIGLLGEAFGILNALYLVLVLLIAAGLAAPATRKQVIPAPPLVEPVETATPPRTED